MAEANENAANAEHDRFVVHKRIEVLVYRDFQRDISVDSGTGDIFPSISTILAK